MIYNINMSSFLNLSHYNSVVQKNIKDKLI